MLLSLSLALCVSLFLPTLEKAFSLIQRNGMSCGNTNQKVYGNTYTNQNIPIPLVRFKVIISVWGVCYACLVQSTLRDFPREETQF